MTLKQGGGEGCSTIHLSLGGTRTLVDALLGRLASDGCTTEKALEIVRLISKLRPPVEGDYFRFGKTGRIVYTNGEWIVGIDYW